MTEGLAAFGLGFLVLGVPLALEIVPPNGVYGFRTRTTLRREDVWYAANRSSGRVLSAWGGVLLLFAVVSVAYEPQILASVLAIGSAAAIVAAVVAGSRSIRDVSRRPAP